MAAKPKTDFESSLARLEHLVEQLDRGELPLEDALRTFEQGVALTRQCQDALKSAQQKVEILLQRNNEAQPAPFEQQGGDGTTQSPLS
jgi:exodeoxyribonuclease VII small subunit